MKTWSSVPRLAHIGEDQERILTVTTVSQSLQTSRRPQVHEEIRRERSDSAHHLSTPAQSRRVSPSINSTSRSSRPVTKFTRYLFFLCFFCFISSLADRLSISVLPLDSVKSASHVLALPNVPTELLAPRRFE